MRPEILAPIFGETSDYIDSNIILDNVTTKDKLPDDWAEQITDQVFHDNQDGAFIAGWSTGAIIAAAVAAKVKPRAIILLSSTPSFVRRESFQYGTRAMVVSSMINELAINKSRVLEQFHERCGFTGTIPAENYSVKTLQNGLFFLINADIPSSVKFDCRVICLHGRNDVIIPVNAGRAMCQQAGGVFHEFDGGHQFFENHNEIIKSIIESIER